MYNYMGFGRAKIYALSELTCEEGYGLYNIYLNGKYIKRVETKRFRNRQDLENVLQQIPKKETEC